MFAASTRDLSDPDLPSSPGGKLEHGHVGSGPPSSIDIDHGSVTSHGHAVSHDALLAARLQVENIECVRTGVESLLEVAQDKCEVCGGTTLDIEIDMVASVVAAYQRILAIGRHIEHVKDTVAEQRRLHGQLIKVKPELANGRVRL